MIRKILFFVPLFVLVISALANIVTAASVSDIGTTIIAIEAKTAALSSHDDEMLQTLAAKQSLTQLKSWAHTQGFVPVQKVVAINPATTTLARATIQ